MLNFSKTRVYEGYVLHIFILWELTRLVTHAIENLTQIKG